MARPPRPSTLPDLTWSLPALLLAGALGCAGPGGMSEPDAGVVADRDARSNPDTGRADGGMGGRPDASDPDGAVPAPEVPASAPPQVASGVIEIPADCDAVTLTAPLRLRCTGLYSDVEAKTLGQGLRPFAPAIPFWSDDADKARFIYLPPGSQIDSDDVNRWVLPVGTRLFKEFTWKGRRVETRMYQKTSETRWLKASYRWDADERTAERFVGGTIMVDGDPYYIPSAEECDQCHKGGGDRALSFEAVLLGLPGAEGVTLEVLRQEGLLSNERGLPETMAIGEDSTGHAAEALGWLHSNCGISCHNGDQSSEAFRTGLRMAIEATQADGRDPSELPAVMTLLEPATSDRWNGDPRLVPGDPESSLVFQLMSRRTPQNPALSMPPIATSTIDGDGVAKVRRWIEAL